MAVATEAVKGADVPPVAKVATELTRQVPPRIFPAGFDTVSLKASKSPPIKSL